MSAAASGWAGWALAHPEFGSSVNPITTRGADYAQRITASPPGFENLAASLNIEMSIILVKSARLCKPCNIFVLERICSLVPHIHTMVYTPVHILWYIYPLTHSHMWFHK